MQDASFVSSFVHCANNRRPHDCSKCSWKQISARFTVGSFTPSDRARIYAMYS